MNDSTLGRLDWDKGGGLLPAIVQDARDGRVLMLGYMNEESLRRTLADGRVTFFSRTRNTLWTKGETSGNRLAVRQVFTDCDDDTVLVKVDREGDGHVCHTGQRSCFYTEVSGVGSGSKSRESGVGRAGDGKAGARP